jgi:hypothetical protein
MVTLDLKNTDVVTLILALELAAKNAHTQYQKSQYVKLKNEIKKYIGE